jgi:hypothetical protein
LPQGEPGSFRAGREAYERQLIALALERTEGNQTHLVTAPASRA